MTERKEAQVRETGSIIITGASATTKRRVEAYIKAEEVQWNAKKERGDSENRWSNASSIISEQREDNEQEMGAQWREYCKKMKQPREKVKSSAEKIIVPTCPPHPVGSDPRPGPRMGGRGDEWEKVIQNWVGEVRGRSWGGAGRSGVSGNQNGGPGRGNVETEGGWANGNRLPPRNALPSSGPICLT